MSFSVSIILISIVTRSNVRHIVAKNPVAPKDGVFERLMLWDDEKCKELVGTPFDKITSQNQKRAGAYKADLCRLYVLYKYGGVYTDDDIWLMRKPAISNSSVVVIRESPVFKTGTKGFYFNAFISVPRKRHPGILKAIRLSLQIIKNIPFNFSGGVDIVGPLGSVQGAAKL